jgi:hypothetical protein
MAKCNDCWCEYYDKNRGNCDQCLKKETEKSKPELSVILKKRTVQHIGLDEKNKIKGQLR